MYVAYFYWQFVVAPTWLVRLIINLERALMIFFSVPTMVTTLFAHWHKDSVSPRRGTLSAIALAYSWNAISRGIGFIIRTAMVLAWLGSAGLLALFGTLLTILFILWPLLILMAFAAGLAVLQS